MVIQNIVARWPGSVHDARMFDNSRLCAQFERGDIDGMLLGDSGYPCRQYLMTPLADPQTQPERRYNVAQISTRNTVERIFGVWERMFPCLSTCLRTKLETTLKGNSTVKTSWAQIKDNTFSKFFPKYLGSNHFSKGEIVRQSSRIFQISTPCCSFPCRRESGQRPDL